MFDFLVWTGFRDCWLMFYSLQPIPYWLYKLHGLNINYNCEICGNYNYRGPKAFQRHFAVCCCCSFRTCNHPQQIFSNMHQHSALLLTFTVYVWSWSIFYFCFSFFPSLSRNGGMLTVCAALESPTPLTLPTSHRLRTLSLVSLCLELVQTVLCGNAFFKVTLTTLTCWRNT